MCTHIDNCIQINVYIYIHVHVCIPISIYCICTFQIKTLRKAYLMGLSSLLATSWSRNLRAIEVERGLGRRQVRVYIPRVQRTQI